jgi:hypothetical protein
VCPSPVSSGPVSAAVNGTWLLPPCSSRGAVVFFRLRSCRFRSNLRSDGCLCGLVALCCVFGWLRSGLVGSSRSLRSVLRWRELCAYRRACLLGLRGFVHRESCLVVCLVVDDWRCSALRYIRADCYWLRFAGQMIEHGFERVVAEYECLDYPLKPTKV